MDGTTPLSQEMKKLLHVLIVDDEAIVRDDIKTVLLGKAWISAGRRGRKWTGSIKSVENSAY